MSKYKPLFLSETAEHFDALEAELIALDEKGGDIGHINEVFRHLHSIKSMSASMGYTSLSGLAHMLEDMVDTHRESATPIVSGEIDIMLRGLDELRQMLQSARLNKAIPSISPRLNAELEQEATRRHSPEPMAVAQGDPNIDTNTKNAGPSWTIRVNLSDSCSMPGVRAFMALHRLGQMGQVTTSTPPMEHLKEGKLPDGELTVVLCTKRSEADLRAALEKIPHISQVDMRPTDITSPVKDPGPGLDRGKPSAPIDHQTVRVRTQVLDFFVNSVGELITLRSFFEDIASRQDNPPLSDGIRRMGTVIRKLQERIMEVRMVSVSALTTQLPRVCRDLARRRSKQISLTIQGTEVELDRTLVQALSNPILHMLRNAVEHGIEPPEQRQDRGKAKQGSISITFTRRHDRVLIEMSDDGAGIDENKLIAKATKLGIIKTADEIPEQQRQGLIFEPGLSTKDDVTDASGRGVGMDVVKETIQRLGGQIRVSSRLGHGTTFTLDLPFTLAIIQILTVETLGHLLALPASRVIKAMPLDQTRLASDNGHTILRSGGKKYQYLSMAHILGISHDMEGEHTEQEVVLVGRDNKASLAIGVDRLTGHREAVLKAIGDLLHRLGPFSSSTVLGDGKPVLILDVDELLARASSSEAQDEQKSTSVTS